MFTNREHGIKVNMITDKIFIYRYGSSRWCWKFENGTGQKLFKELDDILHFCKQEARKREAELYVEDDKGKFRRVSIEPK